MFHKEEDPVYRGKDPGLYQGNQFVNAVDFGTVLASRHGSPTAVVTALETLEAGVRPNGELWAESPARLPKGVRDLIREIRYKESRISAEAASKPGEDEDDEDDEDDKDEDEDEDEEDEDDEDEDEGDIESSLRAQQNIRPLLGRPTEPSKPPPPPWWLLHGGTAYAAKRGLQYDHTNGEVIWVPKHMPGADDEADELGRRANQTPADRWNEAEQLAAGRSSGWTEWLHGVKYSPAILYQNIPDLKDQLIKIEENLKGKLEDPPFLKPTIKRENFWWLYKMLYGDKAKKPQDSIPLIFGDAKKQVRGILYEATNITSALRYLETITSEYFINHMPQRWLDWKARDVIPVNWDKGKGAKEWTKVPAESLQGAAENWDLWDPYMPPEPIEIKPLLSEGISAVTGRRGGSPQKPKKKSKKKTIKKQRKKSKKPIRKQRKQRKKSPVKSYKKRPQKSTKLRR